MEKILKLYTYAHGTTNQIPFPNDEQITIVDFTYSAKRMGGAPTITATVMHSRCLDNEWDEYVHTEFNGEKYFLKQTPTSSKGNTDARYKHELNLVSERGILDDVYFFDVIDNSTAADKPISNQTNFSFHGTIKEFSERLNASLKFSGLDYTTVVDDEDKTVFSESKFLTFNNAFFSNAIQESYKIFNIPYYFVGKTIHFGYTEGIPENVFQYGAKDALLSITKSNANQKIVNRITGVGSADNIPYYYPNPTSKGDIEICVGDNNTNITKENIIVGDYKILADNIELGDKIKYVTNFSTAQIGFGPLYVKTAIEGSVSTRPNQETNWLNALYYANSDDYQFELSFDTQVHTAGKAIITFCAKIRNNYRRAVQWRPRDIKNPDVAKYFDEYYIEEYKQAEEHIGQNNAQSLRFLKFTLKTSYIPVGVYNISLPISYSGSDYGAISIQVTPEAANGVENVINVEVLESETHYWRSEKHGTFVALSDLSISFKDGVTPAIGDLFYISQKTYIQPSQNLMPSIYRLSYGDERFYNAVNYPFEASDGYELKIGETLGDDGKVYNNTYVLNGEYIDFATPYALGKPKEYIQEFDDIKPSIIGATNDIKWEENDDDGNNIEIKQRIDMFADFAYDSDDNNEIDEEGNYKHPYFFAKLRKLPFNLFEHTIDEAEMTISMTSGNCGACNFVIGVNDNQKNTVQVDDDGNLVYNSGNVVYYGNPQEKQNDTTQNEVWIALKKDESTYGMLLPSANIRPKKCSNDTTNDGDTFVILHIDLPSEYIQAAEERLTESLLQYMYENNKERFNFSVKFSRIFFAENPHILAMINENSRLRVKYYNEEERLLYISSYTYKKNAKDTLPEITVELSDELTISQNAIQNAVSALRNEMLYHLGNVDWLGVGAKYFLRKDATSDTSLAKTTFKKIVMFGDSDIEDNPNGQIDPTGDAVFRNVTIYQDAKINGTLDVTSDSYFNGDITIGDYQAGIAGQGAKITRDGNAEMRKLALWEELSVPQINYNRVTVNAGITFDSVGGGIVETVVTNEDGTGTCTLRLEDGEVGAIAIGDLCMGLWHNTAGDNSDETSDDHKGNFTRAGFTTIYFQITDVSGTCNNTFAYKLRDDDNGNGVHPFAQMNFAQRGNISDQSRQAFKIRTTEYELHVEKVSTWTYGDANIVSINGNLDGWTYNGEELSGNGQLFGNAYMYGHMEEIDKGGILLDIQRTGDGTLYEGESETFTVRPIDGVNADRSEDITHIVVKQGTDTILDSADIAKNTFTVAYNDLQADINTFTVEVTVTFTFKGVEKTMTGNALFAIAKGEARETYMGEWSADTTYTRTTRTYPTVTHLGSKWYLVSGTSKGDEPLPAMSRWAVMNGSETLEMDFSNDSNFVVLANKVNTIVRVHLLFNGNDITQKVIKATSEDYNAITTWTRDSGNESDDADWKPTYVDTDGSIIQSPTYSQKTMVLLRHDNNTYYDCGLDWLTRRTCRYTCTITLANGDAMTATLDMTI